MEFLSGFDFVIWDICNFLGKLKKKEEDFKRKYDVFLEEKPIYRIYCNTIHLKLPKVQPSNYPSTL